MSVRTSIICWKKRIFRTSTTQKRLKCFLLFLRYLQFRSVYNFVNSAYKHKEKHMQPFGRYLRFKQIIWLNIYHNSTAQLSEFLLFYGDDNSLLHTVTVWKYLVKKKIYMNIIVNVYFSYFNTDHTTRYCWIRRIKDNFQFLKLREELCNILQEKFLV